MSINKARTRALKLLLLDPSAYHDAGTSSKSMSVLCSIDAKYSCPQGDLALPGKCLIRSDKPYTSTEASNYCHSRGSNVVTIHNEKENKAASQTLRDGETAWMLPIHEKTWTAEKDTIDYWMFNEKSVANHLKCASSQQAVIRKENTTSGCTTYGHWSIDESTNKNIALCVKDAECPFCPPQKKADPVVCIGPRKYVDADGICRTCDSDAVPKGKICEVCASGSRPDYALNKCVPDNRITTDSFVDIPGEVHKCYVDERSRGRLTTNGLCRRKDPASSTCDSGLIDLQGICVGTDAIMATTRVYCLSLMMFRTGTCVANELLYRSAVFPTSKGDYVASLSCGTQLQKGQECVMNPYNVSIRAGMRAMQVVYFNSADEPIFHGRSPNTQVERNKQETYCAVPSNWHFPRCNWPDGNIGFTRSGDFSGCVPNHWRAESKKCPDMHTIEVSGKGGSQCFGYVAGSFSPIWKQDTNDVWTRVPDGSQLPEKDYLHLPRVVIVPGEWTPERVPAQCPTGQMRIINDQCVSCSGAPSIETRPRDEPITCASFAKQMASESLPCFCDVRTKGRFTTNGLCRRIGSDPCTRAGLIDIVGVCVGADAILATGRGACLSLMAFRTGTCVANEMLYEKAEIPTCKGSHTATPTCGTQLQESGKCVTNPYNVSIRTGFRAIQVVYFNGADEPVFVGNGAMRSQQETYIPVPSTWHYPRCAWANGYIGWTRTTDTTGCVDNGFRAHSNKCPDNHTIEITGKGGSECFGYVNGAFASIWGSREIWTRFPGPELPEKDWLNLPRTVIVPGEWMPERLK